MSRAGAGGDGDERSHLLAISGSGRWVVVSRPAALGAGFAPPGALVEVFELPQGAPAGRWTCPEPIRALALLGDDVLVAGTQGGTLYGWEPAPNAWAQCTQLKVHDGPVRALAADGTGTRLVSVGEDGALRVYAVSFASGAPALELVAERWVGRSPLSAAAIDAAGSLVAVAGRDGLVRLLPLAHATGGAVQAVWTVPASVQAVSFAARNAVVAALGVDGMVYAQAIDGAAPRAGWPDASRHAAPPSGLAWIAGGGLGTAVPTGRLLSADEQGEARSWTLAAVPEESKVCWRGRGRVYDVAGFVGTVGPAGAGLAAPPGAALLTDRDVVLVAMTAPDGLQVLQRLPLGEGAAMPTDGDLAGAPAGALERGSASPAMGRVLQGSFGGARYAPIALDAARTEELATADLEPGLLPHVPSGEGGPTPTMLEEVADLGARRGLGPFAVAAAAAGVVGVGAVALAAPALRGAPAAGVGAAAAPLSAPLGAAPVVPPAALSPMPPAAAPADLLGGPSAAAPPETGGIGWGQGGGGGGGGPRLGSGHGFDPAASRLPASSAGRPLTSTRDALPADEGFEAPRHPARETASSPGTGHGGDAGEIAAGAGLAPRARPAEQGAASDDDVGLATGSLRGSGEVVEGAAPSPGASVIEFGSRGAASAPSGAAAAASTAGGAAPSSLVGGSGAVGLAESAGSSAGSGWAVAAAAGAAVAVGGAGVALGATARSGGGSAAGAAAAAGAGQGGPASVGSQASALTGGGAASAAAVPVARPPGVGAGTPSSVAPGTSGAGGATSGAPSGSLPNTSAAAGTGVGGNSPAGGAGAAPGAGASASPAASGAPGASQPGGAGASATPASNAAGGAPVARPPGQTGAGPTGTGTPPAGTGTTPAGTGATTTPGGAGSPGAASNAVGGAPVAQPPGQGQGTSGTSGAGAAGAGTGAAPAGTAVGPGVAGAGTGAAGAATGATTGGAAPSAPLPPPEPPYAPLPSSSAAAASAGALPNDYVPPEPPKPSEPKNTSLLQTVAVGAVTGYVGGKVLDKGLDLAGGWLKELGINPGEIAEKAWAGITEGVGSLFDGVSDQVTAGVGQVGKQLARAADELTNLANAGVDDLKGVAEQVEGLGDTVADWVVSNPNGERVVIHGVSGKGVLGYATEPGDTVTMVPGSERAPSGGASAAADSKAVAPAPAAAAPPAPSLTGQPGSVVNLSGTPARYGHATYVPVDGCGGNPFAPDSGKSA